MNALTVIPYAEFGIQSNFSFLRGASKPEELVVAAKLLGFSAIGLADRNTVAGVVRAEGPERIGCEWWRENHFIPRKENEKEEDYESRRLELVAKKTATSIRDYFRLEDSEGRRFWLYRQGLYENAKFPPRWFMHGVFA